MCLSSGYDDDMNTNQQATETHGHCAPQRSYQTLDYTIDLDDRVCCNGCPHSTRQPEQQFVLADTIHKDKPLRTLPGDVVTRSGKWMVVTWQALHCKVIDAPAMQPGVMHRCDHIKPPGYAPACTKPKKTPQKPVKSASADNWWED